MATCFFDGSGLAKRYIAENGTAWVKEITDPSAGNRVYVARVTLVEIVSAIARRTRRGDITPGDMATALADVRSDFKTLYEVIAVNSSQPRDDVGGETCVARLRRRATRRRDSGERRLMSVAGYRRLRSSPPTRRSTRRRRLKA